MLIRAKDGYCSRVKTFVYNLKTMELSFLIIDTILRKGNIYNASGNRLVYFLLPVILSTTKPTQIKNV